MEVLIILRYYDNFLDLSVHDVTISTGTTSLKVFQKQPSRGVLQKRCSENMEQIYRRTPMAKCDFNKVATPVNTFS